MSARSGNFEERGREDALVVETLRAALPDVVAVYRFGSTTFWRWPGGPSRATDCPGAVKRCGVPLK